MIEDIVKDSEAKMQNSLVALKAELSKLRTGRAHPSLLSHLKVSYYGNETPITQVANITVEDARTLCVTPWEKGMVSEVEKAIMKADLGLNPATAGTVIRVPLPPLTEERRRDLAKLVREEAEKAKISVRNSRRDANQELKNIQKNKEISEDDQRRAEDRIQKITDHYVDEVTAICQQKESDLMSV